MCRFEPHDLAARRLQLEHPGDRIASAIQQSAPGHTQTTGPLNILLAHGNYGVFISGTFLRCADQRTIHCNLQVEALTLRREDGTFEAACNLLRPKETTPAMVLAAAEERAAALGIRVVEHYETGLTEEEAIVAISRLTLERREIH